MNKLQITPDLKVGELLEFYPQLEDKLIEIAPPFRKLKNPFLRKTLGKVTTLRQASKVGGVTLSELINGLRNEVGQIEINVEEQMEKKVKPEWVITENIKTTYDARIDLENGNHPVAKVTKEIKELAGDELYLLITPFLPGPLIDILKDKGFLTFSENVSAEEIHTYIKLTN